MAHRDFPVDITFTLDPYRSLYDEIKEEIDNCCKYGEDNGLMLSTPEDCTLEGTPDTSRYEGVCKLSMDRCCKEVLQKKNECDFGVNFTLTSMQSCDELNDTAQMCCHECRRGREFISHEPEICATELPTGNKSDHLLSGNAFRKCCEVILFFSRFLKLFATIDLI
ncbi:uncharacterized protein LOC134658519 [Cydia amplana]|uniref:uncharacterized protein LOC134658519 n=1 Tax=Cydia amplana TaxID=1869771 RepID=UPI002FE65CD1